MIGSLALRAVFVVTTLCWSDRAEWSTHFHANADRSFERRDSSDER